MLTKRSLILLICGFAGLFVYFFLRPDVEYYASGPISESKQLVESRIYDMAPLLGFSMDTLAIKTSRAQHTNYLKHLNDTLETKLSPAKLNEQNIHLQSWISDIGPQKSSQNFFDGSIFNLAGNLQIQYSNYGKLIRLKEHPENVNPTFVRGDSLIGIANYIVGSVFDYNLENYELITDDFSEAERLSRESEYQNNIANNNRSEALTISWKNKKDDPQFAKELVLSLKPVVREFDDERGFRTEFGFSIQSFIAKNELEPNDLEARHTESLEENSIFSYLFFISVFVLGVFVFSIGIRNIFKGKAEWRRAMVIFMVIAIGVYGWRAIYFINSYNPFLSNAGLFAVQINSLIFGLITGLYAAFAYISWEALARSQKFPQVEIIDALWQRKFFVKETGVGLIHGIGIGGIVIGIISGAAYFLGLYLIQADSQFGFAEAGISPKLLTINISAWTTTWLVCIAQIGFVNAILSYWIEKKWVSGVLTIIIVTIFITVLGRQIGTTGTVIEDMAIYLCVAIIMVFGIKEFGLLTIVTGWWFFTAFFMIQPYLGSPSIEVAYVSWVQIIVMVSPLAYGFIAYRYGTPVNEIEDYIPEYEERIAQHLRVEKEIEIARESQYKLMPLQPPKADGIDVYGFFLPSFEVGGDYFDYVMSNDADGNPDALTMAVVDVSGKSMRAAMPAVFTSGLLLSRMKGDMPADILNQVSEPIYSRTDKKTFITCVLARYDLKSQSLSIANAGHCQPILKRNGVAEFIQTPEPRYPLGIRAVVSYKSQELTLKKGDFLFLYSDGLPEAVNNKGQRFGFEEVPRLLESIDTENLTAQEVSQEIKRSVQKFSNYQLADDTTIICLKV